MSDHHDPQVEPEPHEEEGDEEAAPSLDIGEAVRVLLDQPEIKATALEFARDVRAKAEGSPLGRALLQFGRDWFAGRQAREARTKEKQTP